MTKPYLVLAYETLKARQVQDEALGHDAETLGFATLMGYREVMVTRAGQQWPTLQPDPTAKVRGEMLAVDEIELKKLDSWESRYARIAVRTSMGTAWVYVLI